MALQTTPRTVAKMETTDRWLQKTCFYLNAFNAKGISSFFKGKKAVYGAIIAVEKLWNQTYIAHDKLSTRKIDTRNSGRCEILR